MTDKQTLLAYRLKQAEETLLDAEKMLEGHLSPRSIINRSYHREPFPGQCVLRTDEEFVGADGVRPSGHMTSTHRDDPSQFVHMILEKPPDEFFLIPESTHGKYPEQWKVLCGGFQN